MTSFTSQILPTLDAAGFWSYWIIGLASLLEGWWLTSIIVPGTLIVDVGGALARLGHLSAIDLTWFVALGAILGGEISWHSGRWLGERLRMPTSNAFLKAHNLTRRRGGLALVIGRFFGPVAGFVPLAAALAGMERRRFVRWNIASGTIYGAGHVAIGYLAGDIMARVGPYLPRLALPLALLAALIVVTWVVTRHLKRGLPALRSGASALRKRLLIWPPALAFVARHPQTATFLADRLHPDRGLLLTATVALVLYLVGVFVDGALDLAFVPGAEALDQRIANLAHAYWTPGGLSLATGITQLGHVPVAALVAFGSVAALALWGRRASAIGLAVAVIGNAANVTVLKIAFGRARPTLAYVLETSNSFPSGHAAISVALYGTLAVVLWRERVIGSTTAIVSGVAMAAGIGFTRLYLVEHYLSDVLNGWVVGTIWLVIGLTMASGLQRHVAPGQPRRASAALAMVLCLAGAGWFGVHDVKPPQPRGPMSALPGARIASQVVDIAGTPSPSVSLILDGTTVSGAMAALEQHSWTTVPEPNLSSVAVALWSDLVGHPSPAATVPPAFFGTEPAQATLLSPDGSVILRLWPRARGDVGPGLALVFAAVEDTPEGHVAAVAKDTQGVLSTIGGIVQGG
ncbi:bifunctional DedA family/phosphatase PAP2 family protein [Rhodobacter maris]|uniref:Undecaprenyl-diphosphatase n=1 Tax=Rhodobacter maris TaxID=446682 RepID=A0A285THE1_9RHOB|nr:bifunctional DedA family/phosphatase PAP2 family protein [Rhodobacter maris]SOC21600.1 undecaprenyl-diphosphatase [Rhodobacter maris]